MNCAVCICDLRFLFFRLVKKNIATTNSIITPPMLPPTMRPVLSPEFFAACSAAVLDGAGVEPEEDGTTPVSLVVWEDGDITSEGFEVGSSEGGGAP